MTVRSAQGDQSRLLAVQRANHAGDLAEAAGLAEAALSDGLTHPMLLSVLAQARAHEGRLEEALALMRGLEATVPANAEVINAIGVLLIQLDRLEEAVAEFGKVLAIDPRSADALANRAMALTALSRVGGARLDFAAAIAIDPGHPIAADGLAGLALRRGETEEARRLAELVLSRRPGLPSAVLTLAGADLADGRAAEAEQATRQLAGDARTDAKERVVALGLLGDALDAQRRFSEAFAAWSDANALLKDCYRTTFEGRPGTLALVRSLADALEGRTIPPRPDAGDAGPAQRHIFLLGFPRSGTTLIEQVLEEHPDVVTMPERDCLIEGSRAWLSDGAQLEALCAAPDADLAPFRASYWQRVRAEGIEPAGRVFVDKNPFNSFRLPLIARLFPNACILFARRNPRDILLSCFRHRFQMSAAAWQMLTLEGAAELYAATMKLAAASEAAFGLRMHLIPLEAIVADFDGETRRICDAIGMSWTPALRDFAAHAGARNVATPSGPQLVRGLNARGIGKWRDYEAELAPAMPILAPWLERSAAR